uniref:Charged multivesicular body protein 1a n=1 Tax=Schistocephalus solidus TaxID=70667 RepID=A0A0X3PN77_SCHSO
MRLFKTESLDDIIINLRMSAKQLNRLSIKAEKESALQKTKLKKALEVKNVDGARIYAENAIRKHRESINYLAMESKLDAVQARVQTAQASKEIIKNLSGTTKSLSSAMSSMDLEKVEKIMGNFEKMFTDLDVRTGTLEDSMSSAVALSAPEDQINALIKQVADENGLAFEAAVAGAPVPAQSIGGTTVPASELTVNEEDTLTRRLAQLRQA